MIIYLQVETTNQTILFKYEEIIKFHFLVFHSISISDFLIYCSSMASQISSFPLNTGANIPSLGLGTWQATEGLLTNAIPAALKVLSYIFFNFYFFSSYFLSSGMPISAFLLLLLPFFIFIFNLNHTSTR